MGSDESHFYVSLIVRDKVTRQGPQITTFVTRRESRRGIDRGPYNSAYQPITPYQTQKRFKRTLFIRTKHNTQIFGVIPFIKLQTTLKQQLNRVAVVDRFYITICAVLHR